MRFDGGMYVHVLCLSVSVSVCIVCIVCIVCMMSVSVLYLYDSLQLIMFLSDDHSTGWRRAGQTVMTARPAGARLVK